LTFLNSLRRLILGETWVLPVGVGLAFATVALVRLLSGPDGWWKTGGGAVLAAALVVALIAALRPRS
jgi:hypothetical protein